MDSGHSMKYSADLCMYKNIYSLFITFVDRIRYASTTILNKMVIKNMLPTVQKICMNVY